MSIGEFRVACGTRVLIQTQTERADGALDLYVPQFISS
jgi:hypothetical protein